MNNNPGPETRTTTNANQRVAESRFFVIHDIKILGKKMIAFYYFLSEIFLS